MGSYEIEFNKQPRVGGSAQAHLGQMLGGAGVRETHIFALGRAFTQVKMGAWEAGGFGTVLDLILYSTMSSAVQVEVPLPMVMLIFPVFFAVVFLSL